MTEQIIPCSRSKSITLRASIKKVYIRITLSFNIKKTIYEKFRPVNIICATPSIDKTETRQNRRLTTLGRRWENNKAGNLFITIQYRVPNIVSYTEFMVACMFQVKRFYSLSLLDSVTLLLLLILCRVASSAAL